jgi:molybdopterin molybdotransferase
MSRYNSFVTPLRFEAARQCVIERVSALRRLPAVERVALECASGRVLAEDIRADRSYPPLARSIRDGFAVEAASFAGEARVIGEVRAGEIFVGRVAPGEAVEIMTGAPMPAGPDAVIMVEHVEREGDRIRTTRDVRPGDFVNRPGSEACAGEIVLEAGQRLDFSGVAALATIGARDVPVCARPRVAIIATGDEIVPVESRPEAYQVRNSNSYSLAAQVARAGGVPHVAQVARDTAEHTRRAIADGLESDLLLLSGGVSAGKYDLVESVLAEFGAEFYFNRALIQPGQPVVFGRARDTFFFGLPGNPASTMVTFEVFARAALELLSGQKEPRLGLSYARLTRPLQHKPGLTRFLPARLAAATPEVTPVKYNGSGDVFALARANAFVVAREDREHWGAGDMVEVLSL